MQILIDLAIAFGAIFAAAYCLLLSRRLRALTRLDSDVGRAIAVLSKQVDDLTKALRAAERSTTCAADALGEQLLQAQATARQLELLMAAAQAGHHTQTHRAPVRQPTPPEHDPFTPIQQPRPEADLRRRVVRQRDHMGASQ